MHHGLITVIFTTYNAIEWLEKVLWGFHYQTDRQFEVIIADDGSSSETFDAIERFKQRSHLSIKHVWQPDEGFQKCRIMNKAIKKAQGDYLLFTDGDCIPRNDFVATHRKHAEKGYYLSGGYFKLPMNISQLIDQKDIAMGRAFEATWLLEHGLKKSHKLSKLTATPVRASIMNRITPTRRTWNGHNASGWKHDLLAVNGFDERMQYGGEDCELGFRLRHYGLKAKQIRYSAICIHLDHSRDYVNSDMLTNNRLIRNTTLRQKLRFTEFGLEQH